MADKINYDFKIFLYSEKGINVKNGKESIINYYLCKYQYGLAIGKISKEKDDGINKPRQFAYYGNFKDIYNHLLEQKENNMIVGNIEELYGTYNKAVSEVNELVMQNITDLKKMLYGVDSNVKMEGK